MHFSNCFRANCRFAEFDLSETFVEIFLTEPIDKVRSVEHAAIRYVRFCNTRAIGQHSQKQIFDHPPPLLLSLSLSANGTFVVFAFVFIR